MRDCNILKVDTINSKPINCFRYTCLFQKILFLRKILISHWNASNPGAFWIFSHLP